MTTLETLYASLAEAQDDWQARSILADYYEEAGQQPAADAIRWMIKRRKRPYKSTTGTYHWFNAGRITAENDPESDLPEPVYVGMKGAQGLEMVFRDYDTLQAADEDFYLGWRTAREKGWSDDA